MTTTHRSDRSTRRLEAALTLLGVLGLALFLAFYDRAFPSAALDLDLSRSEIAERAQSYLQQQGYDLEDYESALIFAEAGLASIYLQHTLGIPGTNELARRAGLPLWFWQMRWFKPLQKEEFHLSLMLDGTVVGLAHTLLEDAPGADLPEDAAQALAEAYLTRDRGWDLHDWERVVASSEARPGGRTDHHFEWRRADWDVGESELRLAVDVQGDHVGGYDYWLRVPEAFRRRFSEQRNRAGFVSDLSFLLAVGGFGAVACLFYFLGQQRGIFSRGEGLLPGLLAAGLYLLANLNSLPLDKAWYGTTQDYAVFWFNRLLYILIFAVALGAGIAVLWAGGRYLARRVWPRQDKLLSRGPDRAVTLARSTWRGLMLGGLHAGYVVLFYYLTTQVLGGWAPMDVPSVDLYATPLPFLSPLADGVIPALTEEFLFRLVGIGVLLALRRRRWLALLAPGVLWAFAHLAYLRDPIYLRGIELTGVALLYGILFLRFDLTTTIVAHLAYNAGLTALPLLRSGQPYFVLNGLLVVTGLATPLVPGTIRALRGRLQSQADAPLPTIRPATARDLPGLSRLGLHDVPWPDLLNDASAAVLCLCAGEEVIGAAAARAEAGPPVEVVALYVAPAWRRQYWGSRLADALQEAHAARQMGALAVQVPWKAWLPARFWDTLGWRPTATIYAPPAEPLRLLDVKGLVGWARDRVARLRDR